MRWHLIAKISNFISMNPYSEFSFTHLWNTFISMKLVFFQNRIHTCADLASMQDDKRRTLLKTLTDEEYRDVLLVLATMPRIEISTNVIGEEEVNWMNEWIDELQWKGKTMRTKWLRAVTSLSRSPSRGRHSWTLLWVLNIASFEMRNSIVFFLKHHIIYESG